MNIPSRNEIFRNLSKHPPSISTYSRRARRLLRLYWRNKYSIIDNRLYDLCD